MSVAGTAVPGPFRGLVPFDETSAGFFFGRAGDLASLLARIGREGARVTALTGPCGMGKTSLLRAGLVPALAKQGTLGLHVGSYDALDQEIWQAASRARAETPAAGESAVDYLVRLARASRGGGLLILDHLEQVLGAPGAEAVGRLGTFLSAAATGAGPRLRLLLCVDTTHFHRLDELHAVTGFSPLPGAWIELAGLAQSQVTEILEQTVLQTGTFLENGLAALIAADLCRNGPCLPADLQIVARTVLDLRLTSIRRYERGGGAELLVHTFFDRIANEAGGRPGRRVMLDFALTPGAELGTEELETHTRVPRLQVDQAVTTLMSRGILRKRDNGRADRFTLTHPCLAPRIQAFAAADAAKIQEARRMLRKRVLAGTRLNVLELLRIHRNLAGALTADEQATVTRSFRRAIFHAGMAAVVAIGLVLAIFFDLRTSYSLDVAPADGSPSGRVVVRLGRPSLSPLYFFPSRPSFGDVIADTGFATSSVSQDLSSRIAAGRATGTLERDRRVPLPGWLRQVVAGLRPVPRGVALVLLGDPTGIVSLKQGFADPFSRRDALEALAVIGSGRAGEDEILAAALADTSAEIRRRAVEVAGTIDRRLGTGSHGTTLRSALTDRSFEVRHTVLRECTSLAPSTSAGILSVALADKDASFRKLVERAILDLAERAPAAAADTVRLALRSTDAQARRSGLALLEQVAARAPQDAADALGQIVSDDKAPEDARVAALVFLRSTGATKKLHAFLERAISPESSPRLRTAALPLYARIIDVEKAQEMAEAVSNGPPAARAAGAAIWGAVALKRPDAAANALKSLIFDPSPEVRLEAARALGHLKREGPALVQKALLDPNTEVQRAAIESAVLLSSSHSQAIADILGRAILNVRPATRPWIVEALGKIGQDRPASAMPPLARALKHGDGNTRATVAATFCLLARRHVAASPYLRVAARDADRGVRAAAAACLGSLAEGDPKAGARIAGELAAAKEASVRVAAATSLGALAPKARDLVAIPLLRLLQDSDRSVRIAALQGAHILVAGSGADGKWREDLERALAAVFGQGDPDERTLILRTATRAGLMSVVQQAARDPDEAIRLEAVRSAGTLGSAGQGILQIAVEDTAPSVRTEATRRLASVSGDGARKVLPILEAMLRSADPQVRRAGASTLGDLAGAQEATTRLLAAALRERSESVRAAAAETLGRVATREPAVATGLLQLSLRDPAYDVRIAAVWGLGAVWANAKTPVEIQAALVESEADSARRLVALEALVIQAGTGSRADEARRLLGEVASSGPPLARLAAQVGRAFLGRERTEMHAFLERLLGG